MVYNNLNKTTNNDYLTYKICELEIAYEGYIRPLLLKAQNSGLDITKSRLI